MCLDGRDELSIEELQRRAQELRKCTDDSSVRWVCKRVCKPGLASTQFEDVVAHASIDGPVLVKPHLARAVRVLLDFSLDI
jgi:hypothetical protein